jgi:hypothetical protein
MMSDSALVSTDNPYSTFDKEGMTLDKKRPRGILFTLALSILLLFATGAAGAGGNSTAARPAFDNTSLCLAQCHIDLSDCLGAGGGHDCIDVFTECSIRCYLLPQ